jgi:fumarylacetoacetate (FAA) hydrolase family protein
MNLSLSQALAASLPTDGCAGTLAGRVWRPDVNGPSVVAVREEGVVDVSQHFPTKRDLCETDDPAAALRAATGDVITSFDSILANTPPDARDASRPWLLAPVDLQAIRPRVSVVHRSWVRAH